MYFNFTDVPFIVLSSPTCFGQSCGHLHGDFFDNKSTVVIKVCLNHFTVLKTIQFQTVNFNLKLYGYNFCFCLKFTAYHC